MKDKLIVALAASLVTLVVTQVSRGILVPRANAQNYPQTFAGSQIAADNGTVYILKDGTLFVYCWDMPEIRQMMARTGKLKLMSTSRVDGARPDQAVFK